MSVREELEAWARFDPPPRELCWRCARRGSAAHAIVVCCFCREWVCRRCFEAIEGICRTCAADDMERADGS